MKKCGRIKYPLLFCDLSKDMALARWLIDKDIRNSSSEYTRDSKERELEIETKGILGEMVVRYHLEQENTDYTPLPLIEEHPVKDADIIIKEFKIDIKASNNPVELMVNENAHLKGKGNIDYYWFVILTEDGVADFYVYTYDEVDKWVLGKMTFTNAYVKTIYYNETVDYKLEMDA